MQLLYPPSQDTIYLQLLSIYHLRTLFLLLISKFYVLVADQPDTSSRFLPFISPDPGFVHLSAPLFHLVRCNASETATTRVPAHQSILFSHARVFHISFLPAGLYLPRLCRSFVVGTLNSLFRREHTPIFFVFSFSRRFIIHPLQSGSAVTFFLSAISPFVRFRALSSGQSSRIFRHLYLDSPSCSFYFSQLSRSRASDFILFPTRSVFPLYRVRRSSPAAHYPSPELLLPSPIRVSRI